MSVLVVLGLLVAPAAVGPAEAVSTPAEARSARPATLYLTTWKVVRSAAQEETAALAKARASGNLDKETHARNSAVSLWAAVTTLHPTGSALDRAAARAALKAMLLEIGRVQKQMIVARLNKCTAGSIPSGSLAQGLLVDDLKRETIRAGLLAVLGKSWKKIVDGWENQLQACMRLSLNVSSSMEVGTTGVPGTWTTVADQVIPLTYDVLTDHWSGSTRPAGIRITKTDYVPAAGCTRISTETATIPVDVDLTIFPSADGKKFDGVGLALSTDISDIPVDKVTVECQDGQGGAFTSVHELAPWAQSWTYMRGGGPVRATDWQQATSSYAARWSSNTTDPAAELTEHSSLTLVRTK